MTGSAYDIAAAVMSYWFAALMLYLMFRLVRSVYGDYRNKRTRAKAAAGHSVGILEVVWPEVDDRGKPHPLYGRRYALKRENRLGSARSSDIMLKAPAVAPSHAVIYQKGSKVMLSDVGSKAGTGLNGYRVSDDVPLVDGDEIMLGDVILVLHIMGAGSLRAGDGERGGESDAETGFDFDLSEGDGRYGE